MVIQRLLRLALLLVLATGCNAAGPVTDEEAATRTTPASTAPPPTAPETVTPTKEGAESSVLVDLVDESPGGQWVAETEVLSTQGALPTSFTVRRTDGSQVWTVVDEERAQGLGFPFPVVVRWLPDEQALFYAEAATPDGCAVAGYALSLHRLDLADGSVTTVLPQIGGRVAVSADGVQVAYLEPRPEVALRVRDLATDEEQAIEIPAEADAQLGDLLWSPDATRLLLTVVSNPCSNQESRTFLLLNVADGTVETVVDGETRRLLPVDWPAPDAVTLEELDGTRWTLDPATGEIAPQ